MSTIPNRASSDPGYGHDGIVPMIEGEIASPEPEFERMNWADVRDAQDAAPEGARQVLGWALAIMALLWTGYAAWSPGDSWQPSRCRAPR
jgi:hypothetical protein